MKIKTLKLTNFRGVRDMTLELNASLNVFVGVNGAGKSTVLDAVAILLSQAVAKITDPDEQGKRIDVSDITTDEHYSLASASVENLGECYDWSVLRRRPGFEADVKVTVGGESDLAKPIRRQITETNAECSIPLMVLYPVKRVVDRPFAPQRPGNEGSLETYKGALDGQANFWSFFKWFREQDDIINEDSSGREWFIRNRQRILRKIDRLLTTFETCALAAPFETDVTRIERDREYLPERLSSHDPETSLQLFFDYLEDVAEGFSDESLRIMIRELRYFGSRMQEMFDKPPHDFEDSEFVTRPLSHLVNRSLNKTRNEITTPLVPFIHELLDFTLEVSLWWMRRDSVVRLARMIREYFPGSMQDRAQWEMTALNLKKVMRSTVASELARRRRIIRAEGGELRIVSRAITSFAPEFTDLRISRKPSPRMLVQKNNETFEIDQLSDGEKCLIAMIGDLARRLTIANPTLENPLEGEGVALIDEIDLHLHPKWQRMVVSQLVATFPNVQFILSTHSPAVLSHVEDKSVFLLHQTDEGIVHTVLTEAYGQSYERLLEDVFDVAARPDEMNAKLDELFDLIQRDQTEEARKKLADLRGRIGTDPELVRAQFLLHRKEEAAQ